MGRFEEVGPSKPVTESIRVDKVSPRAHLLHNARATIVIILAIGGLIPVFVMLLTAFKTRADVVSVPPKLVFEPTLEGFVYLLTERALMSQANLEEAQASTEELSLFEQIALQAGQEITGPSDYVARLRNS